MKRLIYTLLPCLFLFLDASGQSYTDFFVRSYNDYVELLEEDHVPSIRFILNNIDETEKFKDKGIDLSSIKGLNEVHLFHTEGTDSIFEDLLLHETSINTTITSLIIRTPILHVFPNFEFIKSLVLYGETDLNNASLINFNNVEILGFGLGYDGMIDSNSALYELRKVRLMAIDDLSSSQFDFNRLRLFSNLNDIRLINCTFQSDLSAWIDLKNLHTISLFDCVNEVEGTFFNWFCGFPSGREFNLYVNTNEELEPIQLPDCLWKLSGVDVLYLVSTSDRSVLKSMKRLKRKVHRVRDRDDRSKVVDVDFVESKN